MTKWSSLLLAAALAVVGFGSTAHAGPISYDYVGAPHSQLINPNAGFGGIAFIAQTGSGTGTSGGAFGALLFGIPSTTSTVGTFTNVAYTTGLTITDSGALGSPHTFNFGGLLNGTLAMGTNTLTNSFTGLTTQSFQIGSNMYTVHINSVALPGFLTPGAVTYDIHVSPSLNAVPEPSTLLLSGLGASCLGLFTWRRRRNVEAIA
jgi:hypothetical protein